MKSREQPPLFRALPWQIPAWRDTSQVLLLVGGAGSGKSRLAAEKMHAIALKYPGVTLLMVRKTRESMTNSTVLFMERTVIGRNTSVRHFPSKSRFEYPNGSILAYGGLADDKQRESIRSIGAEGGLDGLWIEEANRLQETDYNELLARLRGSRAAFRQAILTTNPDAPEHWIKRRLIDGGEASVYTSLATDNIYNPPGYIDTLRLLTGVQRARLLEGKWLQAEGVVYDNFDLANITIEADYNPNWDVIWGVDDGYAVGAGVGSASYHPRVILFMQITPRGGVNVFDEYAATGELADVSIQRAIEKGYALPSLAWVDSSAQELQHRLWNAGIQTANATHPVIEGIRNVRRMVGDGQGERLIHVHPRCAGLIREFGTYRYADGHVSINGEPKPLKQDDHFLDALRYACWHLRYEERE